MIAGVIVSNSARQVDRIFDYKIKDGQKVCVGKRVIVPFGRGNGMCEGYVFEIKETSQAKKLKFIERVAEGEEVFDTKGAELIEWLRDKTLCSYIDAVRLLAPAGTNINIEKWICLLEKDEEKIIKACSKSDIKKHIIEYIQKSGGQIETGTLSSMFDSSVSAQIGQLEQAGIIKIVNRDSVNIKSRVVRFVLLGINEEQAVRYLDITAKKAPAQKRIINTLMRYERLSAAEAVSISKSNYSALRKLHDKGIVVFEDTEVMRDPNEGKHCMKETFNSLTDEQSAAKSAICSAIDEKSSKIFLLHGVTGSGKTEVYMHAIAHAIESGKTAIVLVPEISLTPLMTRRFISRFGKRVAILHSALSLGERYDEWKRIKRGEVDVVVGARSAIFAPLDNIGIIILDEEHEYTYKSEMSPRYHARDVAIKRAKQHKAAVVLASATPLVESYYKAKKGEYTLLEMKLRFNEQKMPKVYIEDMRKELENGNRSMFSKRLADELVSNIKNGQQSILFLNRRGFSTFVSCRNCGYVAKCPHCNISLTYHRYTDSLVCHYCGYTHENYSICPECGSKYIKYFGAGTQKLEEELKKNFEGITTVRMDFDTTNTKSAHEKLLDKFEKEKTDVLIGTQMVSKGLDFHSVTLVGVVAADTSLYIDDYRSSERTFNLIEQVCGRAGRGVVAGRAVVQTYTPENHAIICAAKHDYRSFYEEEIKMRQAMRYPPFCEIVTILISGSDERQTALYGELIGRKIENYLKNSPQNILMLGPSSASISKIKDKYRVRIVIKCDSCDEMNDILIDIINSTANDKKAKNISVSIDKNPNSLS